jgi:outer membrane protein TolC
MKTREGTQGTRGHGKALRAVMVLAVVVLGQAAATAPAAAQSADTTTITLDRALQIAGESNPAYRQAANETDLNAVQMRAAWFDRILPQAQFTLFSTAFYGNNRSRALDLYGNPISRDPVWTYYSSTQQGLRLTWQIQGTSLLQERRTQVLANEDRDVAAEAARLTMSVGVRRGYMDALEQRDLLRAEESLDQARQVDLDLAERLFSLAMKTRVDVLNAELGIRQQELATQRQRAAYERAKLSLRTLLGDEALDALELADEPLPIFDPSGLDADALVHTALDVNPEVARADLGVRRAEVSVARARSTWWPTLSLALDVSRYAQSVPNVTRNTNALFDVSYDEPWDQQFSVVLSFPMFNNFFQNRADQVEAAIERDNQREAERAKRLDIQETVRGSLLELSNQWESLQLAQRSADIAGEALRLAREEYRIGTRTFEDLRQAIDQEADTRRQVIEARYSFVDALLDLEAAVGTEVSPPPGVPPGGGSGGPDGTE